MDWLNRGHVRVALFDQSQGSDERRRELAKRVGEVVKREIGGVEERDQEFYLAVVDALKVRTNHYISAESEADSSSENTGSITYD